MRKRGLAVIVALALAVSPVMGGGYSHSVVKAEQQVNSNLISNGDFSSGTSGWDYFTAEGGDASLSVENGKLCVAVEDTGSVNYAIQLYHEDFQMYKNGVYRLKFDISSSINRNVDYRIQLNGGDYRGYYDGSVAADTTMQTVNVVFTMKEDNDLVPRLCFNFGKVDESLPAHNVYLDNVELTLLDGSGISYPKEEEESVNININQVGYKTDDQKIAVFRGEKVGSSFSVVDTETNQVVYTGSIGDGKYNVAAGETDYAGDFSSVTKEGTYKIVSNGLEDSYSFTIGDDVYEDAFTDAMRFFYLQRCGEELPSALASSWSHGVCHTSKAKIYGTEEYIDVSGGWHDAGDYGRYVVATSATVADLILAYQSNQGVFTDASNIPESGNGQADILDEIKGQLEWLLKMQDKKSGGVYHKVTCASFPAYIAADQETAELIVCPISTQATGDFAAIMALGYDTYKSINPELASTCLQAAERAWNYLSSAPSSVFTNPKGIVTGEYGDTSDRDERYFAAAALYYATGSSVYHEAFKTLVQQGVEMGYDWGYVGSYANAFYLKSSYTDASTKAKIEKEIIENADYLLSNSQNDPYGVSNGSNYYWGSNMATLNNANQMMDAYRITGKEAYKEAAIEHVNYIFGKNAVGTSYVTGYGTVSPKNPHHRPSMVAGQAIPGALVGGPNKMLEDSYAKAYLADKAPAKCYLDHAESYSTNELDIYWNSALVLALANMERVEEKTVPDPTETVSPSVEPTPSTEPTPSSLPTPSVSTEVPTDMVKVTQTTSGNGSYNQTYQITASGDEAIDLSKLEITYEFTKEDTKGMTFYCDNASAQLTVSPWYASLTSSVKGTIEQVGAGYVLKITFDEAFELVPDAGSVQIQARLVNSDWSNIQGFQETNMQIHYKG